MKGWNDEQRRLSTVRMRKWRDGSSMIDGYVHWPRAASKAARFGAIGCGLDFVRSKLIQFGPIVTADGRCATTE